MLKKNQNSMPLQEVSKSTPLETERPLIYNEETLDKMFC